MPGAGAGHGEGKSRSLNRSTVSNELSEAVVKVYVEQLGKNEAGFRQTRSDATIGGG